MSAVVAIVGRPNVGKSALFNRIAGRRIAIVHDQPGVTRDRISAELEWRGRPFTLIDTGGIGLRPGEKTQDIITAAAVQQVDLAIEAAHVILFVVNVQEGVVPLDREVASRLRQCGKPVLLVVNKVDTSAFTNAASEFSELGAGNVFPVTAIHGIGIEELLKEMVRGIPSEDSKTDPGGSNDAALKLAIIGRPNVGKSSLINKLTRSDRVIVSPIPGTTRDAVDVPFEVVTDGRRERYVLIDTAGIRHNNKIDNSIEFYSVKRSEDSIARCDVAVMVLDADAGVTAFDKKIAGKILEEKKACVIVVNKWDLYQAQIQEARQKTKKSKKADDAVSMPNFVKWIHEQLFFLDFAPVIFTSAKSGWRLERFLESVRYVAAQLQQRIPTAVLNRTLHDAIEERQPVSSLGSRLRFFYATQTGAAPPTFLLFINRRELFSDQYEKYLAGQLRRSFGFEGCPLVIVAKARPKTIESFAGRKGKHAKPKRR